MPSSLSHSGLNSSVAETPTRRRPEFIPDSELASNRNPRIRLSEAGDTQVLIGTFLKEGEFLTGSECR